MGFVWEATTQGVELYLQSSVMSLLGGLGCRDPPQTSVLSYQKVMPHACHWEQVQVSLPLLECCPHGFECQVKNNCDFF